MLTLEFQQSNMQILKPFMFPCKVNGRECFSTHIHKTKISKSPCVRKKTPYYKQSDRIVKVRPKGYIYILNYTLSLTKGIANRPRFNSYDTLFARENHDVLKSDTETEVQFTWQEQ